MYRMMRNARKGPLGNLDNAGSDQPVHVQADQGFRCLLIDSINIVVYVDEQRMSRLHGCIC